MKQTVPFIVLQIGKLYILLLSHYYFRSILVPEKKPKLEYIIGYCSTLTGFQ